MSKYLCPRCGKDLDGLVLTSIPPIYSLECRDCGFQIKESDYDKILSYAKSSETKIEKPPIGCKPYYVAISERVDELCKAIERNAAEAGKHNKVRLWVTEIHLLNEMDRILRRVEAEKTWVENKDGTLKEVE